MSRAVASTEEVRLISSSSDTGAAGSGYSDRLLKYIPAEVVTLYVALIGIVNAAGNAEGRVLWGIFAFGIVAVIVHLKTIEKKVTMTQLIISTLSFVVWAFALPDGPFTQENWYNPLYGALLLPAYTFLVARIAPSVPPSDG